MPNTKITAMPSLAGNQVPTDLVTAVDLSAAPVNQNVKSTLNDLFATITKNITDRAIRFQAPGSAPAVSSANQGALYHNGTEFLASSNGGAYEELFTLSAQSAALIFAGPTSGPAATPMFRALALTDLPTLATASLLGRFSAGTGTPEQITSTAALLTWLQNPISANLSAAVTDSTGAGGALVFANGPILTNPRLDFIGATTANFGTNLLFSPSLNAVNFIEILNAVSGSGPTLRAAGSQTNVQLNIASKGNGIISAVANQFRITSNAAAGAGILELRGGNASLSGGQIRLYEVTTNGTNYIGFQAPDSLASNLLFELPATDGTAGQALVTDGNNILSWNGFEILLSNQTITPTTADVTATVNTRYFADISGLTATRNFIIPAGSSGDQIELTITRGDNQFELVIIGNTGISINNGPAASEWSRVFNTGESVILVADSANNWQVMVDGRIPTQARVFYSGSAIPVASGVVTAVTLNTVKYDNTPQANTVLNGGITNTDTTITVVSTDEFRSAGGILIGSESISYTGKTSTTFTGCTRGFAGTTATTHSSGASVTQSSLCSITTSQIIPRRTNKYLITAGYRWQSLPANATRIIVYAMNPVLVLPQTVQQIEMSALAGCIPNVALATTTECIGNNYLELWMFQNTGSTVNSNTTTEIIHMEISEIL